MTCITLTEYDVLFPDSEGGSVPDSCFKWLRNVAFARQDREEKEFFRLVARKGKEGLQLRNYVGVLQTPDGTCIEILPKTSVTDCQRDKSVYILLKMLRVVFDLPALEATSSDLDVKKRPLIEILISRFLDQVAQLVHRGIRSDYSRTRDTKSFLKGKLRVAQQLRQPVSKQHKFCIEYDQFLPDRAENRLIKSALDIVLKWTQSAANQRLCRELLFSFSDIPISGNYKNDLSRWSTHRDMVHYRSIEPWVRLILANESPWFMSGSSRGISMLFPMEQLFERYVGKVLKRQLSRGYKLREQVGGQHLTTHNNEGWFKLRPDFVVSEGKYSVAVLDAKWKLLDAQKNNKKDKYGLSQSDLYQLFAYGEKYLPEGGDLFLVYPCHALFSNAIPSFDFNDGHKLWVVPFDLDQDRLLFDENFGSDAWVR